jgi:hypothetical protein
MKRQLAVILITLILVLTSCDLFDPEANDPEDEAIVRHITIDNDGIPDWYPSTLVFSPERIAEYDSTMGAFRDTFNFTREDMHSYDRNDICAHIGNSQFYPKIKIAESFDSLNYENDFIDIVKDFTKEWWRIISAEPFEIVDYDIKQWMNFGDFDIKSYYEYPLYKYAALGMFRVYLDTSGSVRELYSSLAPQLNIPKNPMYDADSARAKAIGFEWHYHGFSGERVDCVVDSSDIGSASLKVYIDRKSDEYVYRLIWCISTNGLPIDIIYDAMTGEFIRYIQNFRT